MRNFHGYLQMHDQCSGVCTEVLNRARTCTYIKNLLPNHVRIRSNCPTGCGCWTYNTGAYDTPLSDGAPWVDPMNPATWEALGFLPDAYNPNDGLGTILEYGASSRIAEADTPLRPYLTQTGTVFATSERGLEAWLNWANRVYRSECLRCNDFRLRGLGHCPCEDTTPAAAPALDPARPVLTLGDDDHYIAAPLGDPPPARMMYDDGVRDLAGVRFESIDALTDRVIPNCFSRRIVIRFSVRSGQTHGNPIRVGELTQMDLPLLEESVVTDCKDGPPPGCHVGRIIITDPACTVCAGNHPTGACSPARARVRRGGRIQSRGGFRQPASWRTMSLLTPSLPASIVAVPIVELRNGQDPVDNVRVLVWKASPGIPDPMTVAGNAFYCNVKPVHALEIPRLDSYEVLTWDGREGTVRSRCVTGECRTGALSVESCGAMTCGDQYWIAIQTSCDPRPFRELTDLTMEAWLAPEYST